MLRVRDEPYDAAPCAARLRFRPIIVTSLAFILGVVPLVLSTGAGAASRHSIGTGVIGGMLAATLVATLFVPFFYVLLTKRSDPKPAEEPEPSPAEAEAVKGSGSSGGLPHSYPK